MLQAEVGHMSKGRDFVMLEEEFGLLSKYKEANGELYLGKIKL